MTKLDKHIEVIPFVIKQRHLFDRVLVNTTLKTIGFDNYIVFHCDIPIKYMSWYIYQAEKEYNFINVDINSLCSFTFKVPDKYQWYVPIVYKTGVKSIHPNHIHKFFINENAQGRYTTSGVF